MHRTINQIKSMIIFIILSIIVIILCESESYYMIRQNIVSFLKFLDGKKNIISNIFIGIFCSSIIAIIGYIHEYFSERKKSINGLFNLYIYVRNTLIPNLGNETKKEILKLGTEDDKLYKIRESLEDFDFAFLFFHKCLNFINKFNKDDKYNIDILELKFCPKHIKVVHVLTIVSNYYSIMTCIYYNIYSLLKEHKEDKERFQIAEIYGIKDIISLSLNSTDELLRKIANEYLISYKNKVEEIKKYYTIMKNTRKKIIDVDFSNRCRELDIELALFKVE